jgi:hypothetical protein
MPPRRHRPCEQLGVDVWTALAATPRSQSEPERYSLEKAMPAGHQPAGQPSLRARQLYSARRLSDNRQSFRIAQSTWSSSLTCGAPDLRHGELGDAQVASVRAGGPGYCPGSTWNILWGERGLHRTMRSKSRASFLHRHASVTHRSESRGVVAETIATWLG